MFGLNIERAGYLACVPLLDGRTSTYSERLQGCLRSHMFQRQVGGCTGRLSACCECRLFLYFHIIQTSPMMGLYIATRSVLLPRRRRRLQLSFLFLQWHVLMFLIVLVWPLELTVMSVTFELCRVVCWLQYMSQFVILSRKTVYWVLSMDRGLMRFQAMLHLKATRKYIGV